MRIRVLLALAFIAYGGTAIASGYQVALQGQKQAGMGHTGTALAWDASSIFFNPGSLAFLKKSSVVAGASFIYSKVAYVPEGSTTKYTTNSPVGTPFGGYAAIKFGKLVVGFGAYTPFGSTINWGNDFAYGAMLRKLSFKSIVFQPTVSYRVSDKIGIGAGLTINTGDVDLSKSAPVNYLNNGDTTGSYVELKGKAKTSFGFNVGIHVQASENFSVGASFRTRTNAKVADGTATYTGSSIPVLSGAFPAIVNGVSSTKFSATLPQPAVLSFGVGVKPIKGLTLAADLNYTFWSAYKELRFDFNDNFGGSKTMANPRNYKDVVAIRVGANYDVVKQLSIRAGTYYDITPVQSGYMTAETPDANRVGASVGIGIRPIENLHIDASLVMIFGEKRTQTQDDINKTGTQSGTGYTGGNVGAVPNGTFQQRAIIPGVSIGYNF